MTSGMRNSVPYDTSRSFLLTFYRTSAILLLMDNRAEIPYGTLDLMVLKTLDTLGPQHGYGDRKSTRLNSSHLGISYAVFCLKKKKKARYNSIAHTHSCFSRHRAQWPRAR